MADKDAFFAGLPPCAIPPTPMPALTFSPLDAPLRDVFGQVLGAVGGLLGAGRSLAEVDERARSLIADGQQVLSLVEGVAGNRDPAALRDPHELADVDYTIAPARLAVAENGAVWISGEDLIQRNAVFICEHLIAVCRERDLVGTLSEAITAIGPLAGNWGAFISGPSKTADIEQALVMGAHGARSCTVYLLAD